MSNSYTRTTFQRDVDYLSDRLRDIDILECKASAGLTAAEALQSGFDKCSYIRTVVYRDRPAAIFGLNLNSGLEKAGVIWLLGSDDAYKATDVLVKNAKTYLDEMLAMRPILFNYVSMKNEKSIKWLKWLGFKLRDDKPITLGGEPFCLFTLRKE